MQFSQIRFLAGRLARSQKRRSFLSFARGAALISIILGTMALIISLSVLEGFQDALLSNAVKFTSHLNLTTINRQPVHDYMQVSKRLRSRFGEISAVNPVVEKEALVRSKKFVEGILIKGVLVDYRFPESGGTSYSGSRHFSSDSSSEIIMGRRLADKLDLKIGDDVIIYAVNSTTGSEMPDPLIKKLKLTGIYETGMAKYDDIIAYLPYKTTAALAEQDPLSATSFEIYLKDIRQAQTMSRSIEDELGFPFFCRTVFDIHRSIFAWIELQKEPIPLVLGLISIVAVLNILTTLLITVVEKTRSIGILRALGMGSSGIMSLFIAQGVSIGMVGAIIGSSLAFAAYWLQSSFHLIRLQGDIYFLDVLPISFNPLHYGVVFLFTLIISFLSTLIPSFISIKISPIKAIRYN